MALTSVSKSKKAQPSAEDSSAFGQIAERFRRAGDLERAVSLCREGLQKSPDHVSARVTLGWALLELGKFDEAREELEHVLRRRPDNLAAIRALAELHDRAEQTLNLPMDGPGQWPPSPDQVDEMAGAMVADHFRAVSAEESIDPSPDDAEYRGSQPAVVPPAELGLAMWSALPATEAAEPEHLSISPASIVEPEVPAPAAQAVSDADIAALLAEAESLEALVEAGDAPVAPIPPPSAGRATALADLAFQVAEPAGAIEEAAQTDEPALVLDAQPDLEVLTAFETAFVAPPAPQTTVPGLITHADLAAQATPVEPEPTGPIFQLESLSAQDLESSPVIAEAGEDVDQVESAAVDLDAQPILRFDLEPVAELAEPAAPAQAAVKLEPEPAAPIAIMPAESVVEAAVIASAHDRIAEVVAMARSQEVSAARPKASIVALERFLERVQTRRRLMTESVA